MLTLALSLAATVLLTFLLRRVLISQGIVDVPNARSSHSRVVPRGGGLSIVVTFLGVLVALAVRKTLAPHLSAALIGGGALVAGIGMVDDARNVSSWIRLIVHFSAATWAIFALGGSVFPALGLPLWLGRSLAIIGIVWMVNLFNFMDGIDGLAGSEAIFAAAGAFVLIGRAYLDLPQVLLLLSGACAGFLVWNWPPAKIFMGDVGSGFLGFVFGVLAIATSQRQPPSLWVWAVLLGAFVADATVTLSRRVIRGERWYSAHRSHAYQHASRMWGSHKRVTLAVTGLNIFWLLPVAWLATRFPDAAPALTLTAMAPVMAIAFFLGAGAGEGADSTPPVKGPSATRKQGQPASGLL